jgi:hypothetical protein
MARMARLAAVVCRQAGGPHSRPYLATSCRALLLHAAAGRRGLPARQTLPRPRLPRCRCATKSPGGGGPAPMA